MEDTQMTTPTETKNQDAAEEVSMKKFKRLILQMKLDPNYEMRILAEEEIINMFEDEREKSKKLVEALVWCDEMLTARDQMNCKVHCAPVRLSPITERVKMALAAYVESEAK